MASTRELRQALDSLDRESIAAFLESVQRIKGNIVLAAVVEAVESGDPDAVFDALGINPGSYQEFDDALRSAFVTGGNLEVRDLPAIRMPSGQVITFGFNANSPRAQDFLRSQSSRLIVQISETQRSAVRVTLNAGAQKGQGPRQTALDIVGRVNRQTGRREGGVIGLDSSLADASSAARSELFSDNRSDLRKALGRTLISPSAKRMIQRALDAGETLSAAQAQRIATMYESSLLRLRGERIARTETLNSYGEGRDESVKQVVDSGAAEPSMINKRWDSSGDGRVRDTHRQEDGQTVNVDQPFVLSSGARLMRPGDTSLGAPASETINCRCIAVYDYDFIGRAVRRARASG